MMGELEPIERASEDELRALQLSRLQWSVRHTYEHVAPYRRKCEALGVHPDDLKTLANLAQFPSAKRLTCWPYSSGGKYAGPIHGPKSSFPTDQNLIAKGVG